jgi:hypothetical protein
VGTFCPGSQPAVVSAADFSALYQRCVASGLIASMNIKHAAGCQIFTVTCNIPVPAATDNTAGRRRRRRRRRQRRGRAATAACEEPAPPSSPSSATIPAVAAVSVADLPQSTPSTSPPATPPPPSPETLPPPAKKPRRRRNEIELLRDHDDEDELNISPTPRSRPTTPPSATPPSSIPHATGSLPSTPITPWEEASASPLLATPAPSIAFSSPSPCRSPRETTHTLHCASSPPQPPAPLDYVPAPPTPSERPEPPPPVEPAPASPPPPAADSPPPPPAPSPAASLPSSSGYTIVYKWCPSCKRNCIEERDQECYPCQDRRYYYAAEYEQE